MPNYAIIKNNIVQNAVLADAAQDIQLNAGETVIQHDTAAPGWVYNGTTLSPPPPLPVDPTVAAEANRAASFRADAGRVDLLSRLKTATPAQIDTWVDNNVTTLAGAKTVFKAILKVIALDIRS